MWFLAAFVAPGNKLLSLFPAGPSLSFSTDFVRLDAPAYSSGNSMTQVVFLLNHSIVPLA